MEAYDNTCKRCAFCYKEYEQMYCGNEYSKYYNRTTWPDNSCKDYHMPYCRKIEGYVSNGYFFMVAPAFRRQVLVYKLTDTFVFECERCMESTKKYWKELKNESDYSIQRFVDRCTSWDESGEYGPMIVFKGSLELAMKIWK